MGCKYIFYQNVPLSFYFVFIHINIEPISHGNGCHITDALTEVKRLESERQSKMFWKKEA